MLSVADGRLGVLVELSKRPKLSCRTRKQRGQCQPSTPRQVWSKPGQLRVAP